MFEKPVSSFSQTAFPALVASTRTAHCDPWKLKSTSGSIIRQASE